MSNDLPPVVRRCCRGDGEFWVAPEPQFSAWVHRENLELRQAYRLVLAAGIFPECWERNFPALGPAEQLALWDGRVLVAGLGGLGGVQAMLLARIGVGHLWLADGDVFSAANLNRQILATHKTLGLNKALVTSQHIQDINPAILTKTIMEFLTPENLPAYLSQVQVVLDGLDSPVTRQHLFNTSRQVGRPLIHGAVVEHFGQVTTVLPEHPIIFDKIYPGDQTKRGETAPGVLATTVTLIAGLQVQEAIRLLVNRPPAYAGRLIHVDGETGRLESLLL